MPILVTRNVVTPNTVMKPQDKPFALRICLNNPGENYKVNGTRGCIPIEGLEPLPYLHGRIVCFEYDYSADETKRVFVETVKRASDMYLGNPNLIAVEGFGIGQWGEGTRSQYDAYRGVQAPICPIDDQRFYMQTLKDAFPAVPLMARWLRTPVHDPLSVYIGMEFTKNTYDDVFLGINSHVLQRQIRHYGNENAFHGAEVHGGLQEYYAQHPGKFIADYEAMGRNLAYMAEFWYKPKNDAERDGIRTIYNYVTGVKK